MISKYIYTYLICGALLLLPGYVLAAEQPKAPLSCTLMYDRYWSPYASSPLLMSARTGISQAEDWLWPQPHDAFLGRCLCSSCNTIINLLLMITNHEVNGHGFRSRSFHTPPIAYGLFPPVTWSAPCPPYHSWDRELLDIKGGSEANSVLAKEIIFKHFAQGSLDHRACYLFLLAFADIPGYILFYPTGGLGHDYASYVEIINYKHGYEGVKYSDLQKASSVFLLNPMLYVSIGSLCAYIFKGQTQQPIPHISVGAARYMPIIRMGLTPFGVMYYVDNYVSYGERTVLASLHAGHSRFYTPYYGGLTLKTDRLWSYKRYSLGAEVHAWYQPPLRLQSFSSRGERRSAVRKQRGKDKNACSWGGMLGIDNQLRLSKYFSLNATLLYKKSGFVEGVVATRGFLWRGGITLHY